LRIFKVLPKCRFPYFSSGSSREARCGNHLQPPERVDEPRRGGKQVSCRRGDGVLCGVALPPQDKVRETPPVRSVKRKGPALP
jgi:hypothetical protein